MAVHGRITTGEFHPTVTSLLLWYGPRVGGRLFVVALLPLPHVVTRVVCYYKCWHPWKIRLDLGVRSSSLC